MLRGLYFVVVVISIAYFVVLPQEGVQADITNCVWKCMNFVRTVSPNSDTMSHHRIPPQMPVQGYEGGCFRDASQDNLQPWNRGTWHRVTAVDMMNGPQICEAVDQPDLGINRRKLNHQSTSNQFHSLDRVVPVEMIDFMSIHYRVARRSFLVWWSKSNSAYL